MFKLLYAIAFVAFIDPLLLYWLWPHLNFWVELGGLLLYPLLADILTRFKKPQNDVATGPIRLGTRIAAWYLGPISKLLSLFLLIPPIERALARSITRSVQAYFMRGMSGRMPGMPDVPPAAPESRDASGLKQTRG